MTLQRDDRLGHMHDILRYRGTMGNHKVRKGGGNATMVIAEAESLAAMVGGTP